MIRLLERRGINESKWNNCVDQSLHSSVTGYVWYLDLVSPDWSALIMNDYQAVLPLPIKKKYGISYLLQPLFTKTLGIYFNQNVPEKTLRDFLEYIPSYIKRVDINIFAAVSLGGAYEITPKKCQQLNLGNGYEEIRKGYHTNVVRNLKKATTQSLSLFQDISYKQIIEMYKVHVGYKIKHLHSAHYILIEKILENAEINKCGFKTAVLNKNGDVLASAFFMKTNTTISFYIGSSTPAGKKAGAITFLFDSLFNLYNKEYKTFDFEGSSIKTIADFNKKFGAKDCVYLQIRKSSLLLL